MLNKIFAAKLTSFILFLTIFLTLHGCNNKQETTDKPADNKATTSDLVQKEADGRVKVNLAMKPKKGDKFSYKMIAKTTSKENSPLTQMKDFTTEQEINYFFTQEVNDVDASNIITYRVKFDSINIVSNISSQDTSISMKYNSNIKDSIYSQPDFIQYNSVIGQDFFLRVSSEGEITDVYGMEKIYDNIYKAFGDTLREQDKRQVRESFGADVKSKLQQQFQLFPKESVYKDSTWKKSYETGLLVFPARNNIVYTLKDIQENNKEFIATIAADLSVEFLEKSFKDRNITSTITDSKTNGKGTITFNVSKGNVITKETTTSIDLTMKLSAGGQSATSKQNVVTFLRVDLLQSQPAS